MPAVPLQLTYALGYSSGNLCFKFKKLIKANQFQNAYHNEWNTIFKEASKLYSSIWKHIQFSSVAQSCQTLWPHELQHTNSRSLLKPMFIESVMPSSHLILCHPLLLLPSIFPSIRVFSNESALCISWPKYWSFTFSISPSNEYSGLISFMVDWLDLLAVQGTLKSLLQHHSSKAPILWCSTFFMVQLWHPYMTTGKSMALTVWTFVSKVMSLLFNTLSRFVTALLPRSKHLLISQLQLPSHTLTDTR